MSRRFPRIRARLTATVTLEDKDDVLVSQTRDISHEGCFLDTAQLIDRGTRVSVALMDSNSGQAFEIVGAVTRCLPPRADGSGRGVGVRFDDPPVEWSALVDQYQRRAPSPERPAIRMRLLVVGDRARQRGAMALYVTSGWDVRFATEQASAEEALRGVKLNAVIAECELSEARWREVLDAALRIQPDARRIVRASLPAQLPADASAPLVDRVVDRHAGLEALLDALTADLGRGSPQALP